MQPQDVVVQQPPKTYMTEDYVTPKKLIKTPDLPPFSGAKPVPKAVGSNGDFRSRGFLTHIPRKLYMLQLFTQ